MTSRVHSAPETMFTTRALVGSRFYMTQVVQIYRQVGDEAHPNVGGSDDFTTVNVGAWSSVDVETEFGAGGAVFTLGGLTPGQEVILYAAAGWAPAVEGKGAYIVFGDRSSRC